MFSYAVAITVDIISICLSSLGVVIQRKSHIENDKLENSLQKHSLQRPLWWFGFLIYLIPAATGSFFGITSLPILVIAPIGTFTLFFNAIYSHFFLKEDMTLLGGIGTVVMAASAASIAILMDIPQETKNIDELVQFMKKPLYITYITFVSILTLVAVIVNVYLLKKDKIFQSRKNRLTIAIIFIILAYVLASQAVIFAKESFDLISLSFTTGQNQFLSVYTYLILFATIVVTVLQLVFFNMAIHYYTLLVLVPIGYSVGIIMACVNTLIYYDSFFILETWKTILVVSLVILIICGIILLSMKKSIKK